MGLRDKIQTKLGKAFDSRLSDAVKTFTATHLEEGDYNPITGEYTGETITYSGRGVFEQYAEDRIDEVNILFSDTLLIVLANEVERVPEIDDVINGMRVKNVQQDPALAHYEVQLSKPGV